MKNVSMIGGGLAAAALLSVLIFLIARAGTGDTRSPAQAAVLIDRSDSRTIDCDAVTADSKALFTREAMGPGSKISLFATGDASTGDEPILLGVYEVPFSRRVQEGRGKVAAKLAENLAKIASQCGQLTKSSRSPIILGVKRSIAHLRNLGCREATPCFLRVQTDLEELSEKRVNDAISGKRKKTSSSAPLIDNSGVEVYFCGSAELKADRGRVNDIASVEIKEASWRNLFSDQRIVIFNPHCIGKTG